MLAMGLPDWVTRFMRPPCKGQPVQYTVPAPSIAPTPPSGQAPLADGDEQRRRRCRRSTRVVHVFLKSAAKELASASLKHASFKQLRREPKVTVNPDDQQLLEVTLALHDDTVAGFFWRDRIHLDELSRDLAVGAGRMGCMSQQSELDLGLELAELTP